jgi:hypothetical protein
MEFTGGVNEATGISPEMRRPRGSFLEYTCVRRTMLGRRSPGTLAEALPSPWSHPMPRRSCDRRIGSRRWKAHVLVVP